MQLAGYLRGSAQQEWDLLLEADKRNYTRVVQALQGKLEPVNKTLAAQDFCHISQTDHQSVADFIRRLEHTFKVAYEHATHHKLIDNNQANLIYTRSSLRRMICDLLSASHCVAKNCMGSYRDMRL